MYEQVINIERMEDAVGLFGSFDENVKLIENEYAVRIVNRGSVIKITGEPDRVSCASKALEGLLMLINKGEELNEQNVRYCISLVNEGSEDKVGNYDYE